MSEPIGPGEIWAAIEGTSGDYEVSSLGRVRRTREMRWGQLPAWGAVRCQPNNHGYPMFDTVCGGRRINVALHLVVLKAFRGERPPGLHGAHLNGDKSDARLTNLAYVTPAENAAHKILHGTQTRGERHHSAKLTQRDVDTIRASAARNVDIAREYGLNRHHVSDIRRGAVWGPAPASVERRSRDAIKEPVSSLSDLRSQG